MTIWTPDITQRNEPKYLAIANILEDNIREGLLEPGQTLPTHRELADRLGLTVGTVTRAYAEAERRGLVRGETGRGTFVARDVRIGKSLTIIEGETPGFIDLSLACTKFHEDDYLRSTLREIADDPDVGRLMEYRPSRGTPRHRETGVQWAAKYGVHVPADNILVTAGAQHALTILLSTLFNPGDRILTEALTYPVFKTLAAQLQLRLVPIAMDEDGLIPEDLEAACSKNAVKALYTIPSIQNPTNTRLSEERRARTADIAKKHDLWIIEDDCYALALPDPPVTLFHYAPERTFFIAGTSKLLSGGLRVGFLVAPRKKVMDLSLAITNTIWVVPPLMAEIVTKWIEDGTADTITQIRREQADERTAVAAKCLEGFSFRSRPTSYFIWLELPELWTGEEFEREALKRGVGTAAAERFIVGQAELPRAARVSLFGPRTPAILASGLRTLVEVLRDIPGAPRELV